MIEAWKRKRAAEGLLAAFRGGERFPALLFWKVTERQVVRSPYEARPRRDRDELSAYQGQSILQQAADAGTRKVSFTGSDPILWDQFGELLRFAREVGLLTEVTAWGPLIVKKADDLAQAGRVTIPLFGGQRVHDAIVVGNRVYEQAIAGLRALRARDAAVTLEFAPTRKNVSEI
ncbi:MAG: radical SAM protein, partial [Myxococcales bacterium]|nr:radical SAM protein [Myxococcales bacterium]